MSPYSSPMSGISASEIKRIKSLSSKKFRDEYGLFTVEGEKMVAEALSSRFRVKKVYSRDEIGDTAMARISQLSSPSPVLALVNKPETLALASEKDVEDALAPSGRPAQGLFLALDAIRDPGNLGTILRIADWFGIDAVFASHDTVDVFNPKVVQSTMGAIFRVRFHYVDIPLLERVVTKAGGRVYGTFLDGDNIYRSPLDCGQSSPSVIIVGNESDGISPQVAALVSDRLFIPPYPAGCPGSESLNAAVATAVTVAEFRRRTTSGTDN